ncbi:MAG: carbohydrate kinase family protein [Candidatus Gottesmanbacteria bacterium]
MKIIVTGSLAFDFIMDFPGRFSDHILPEKIHAINLSFLVNTMTRQNGGTAGNIAYNLALLHIKPIVIAVAGNDFDDYKKSLDKVGVDTSLISCIQDEPTASAYIFTDKVDNQIAGFYPGAMRASAYLKIENLNLKKDENIVVISPNDPVAMTKITKECKKLEIDYMFDPGMQLPRLSDQELKNGIEGAKIVIGNDYEISLINKRIKNYELRIMDDKKIWITTLGDKGSLIELGKQKYKIPPAKPKEILDPTGAGDAYRAGFLTGFLTGQSLEICGRMGSIASVYTVEKYGTQTHEFTLEQFKKRYKENFKEELKI